MERLLSGRYRLGDDIGAGGTSRVFRAVDERLGRPVAVKLLNSAIAASADPSGRNRFLQECRTSAGFTHPAAVTVFDAGEDDGDLFLVMELVEGQTLAERLARTGPLPVSEAMAIASDVLGALGAAHAAGIVHRDVKPANILLGREGHAKLADFGIAKRFDELEESVTATGLIIGTPRYLAPEQASGRELTFATDVYAVGIVLFEMISGRPPFTGDSAVAIAVAQQSTAAPDIRTVRPAVPSAVAATIARALAVDPADRHGSAAELAAELELVDDTELGPSPATMLMPDGRTAGGAMVATRMMPSVDAPSTDGHAGLPAEASRKRLLIVAVVAIFAVVGAVALANRDGGQLSSSNLDALVLQAGTTSPPSLAPTETPAPTNPFNATVLPTVTVIREIIPGFPFTDDLGTFLEQVERDPALVGSEGDGVAKRLRTILEERGRGQAEETRKLREELVKWSESGEVDPSIAGELDRLLAPLDPPKGDDEDVRDDDD